MRLTIEIEDKLAENIKAFCKMNNMTYSAYLSGIIEERFNLDRFGDLNKKLKKAIDTSKTEQKVEMVEVKAKPVENSTEEKTAETVTEPQPQKKTVKRALKVN